MSRLCVSEISDKLGCEYPDFDTDFSEHFPFADLDDSQRLLVRVMGYYLDRIFGLESPLTVSFSPEARGPFMLYPIDISLGESTRTWTIRPQSGGPLLVPDTTSGLDFGVAGEWRDKGLGVPLYIYMMLCAHRVGGVLDSTTMKSGAKNVWRRLYELDLAFPQKGFDFRYMISQSISLDFLPADAYQILPSVIGGHAFETFKTETDRLDTSLPL